jgi:hypothetical protein
MARETSGVVSVQRDALGKKVLNYENEHVGKITDVIVDCATGHVTYAIMSFSGFLGIGDKLFAVPWVSLSFDPEHKAFLMKADKELLKSAPGFDDSNWPDLSDPLRRAENYRYYGTQP